MEKRLFINGINVSVSDTGTEFYDCDSHKKLVVNFNKTLCRNFVNIRGEKFYAYRLVARAFPEICGEWFDGCEVHHLDENSSNDRADNLRVVSIEEHHNLHYDEIVSHLPEYYGYNDKPVYQYSLSGEFIKKWSSAVSASEILGLSYRGIGKAARGGSDTSGDYIWRYEYTPSVEPIMSGKDRTILGNYHPVSQYTKSGEWVRDYDSLKEAAETIGVGHSGNIASCCIGQRKSAYGYVWKYKSCNS